MSRTNVSGGRLRKKWKFSSRPASRKSRMPFATSSEPASTLGQKTSVCIPREVTAFSVALICSKPRPYSVVTGAAS